MSRRAFNLLQLKAVLLLTVRVFLMIHLAEKHIERAYPESPVAVELSVYDKRLARFGVVGYVLGELIVALEVPVHTLEFKLSHHAPSGHR